MLINAGMLLALWLMGGCSESREQAAINGDTLASYRNILQSERAGRDRSGELAALDEIARYFNQHQQTDSALSCYQQEVKLAQESEEHSAEVRAWIGVCRCYELKEQYDEGGAALDSAVKAGWRSGNPKDIAFALQERGIYFLKEQQNDSAIRYFEEELKYDRILNDSLSLSTCLSNLATAHAGKGNFSVSVARYREAIQIAEDIGRDTMGATYSLNLGIVLKDRGDYDEALDYLLNAARFYNEVNMLKEQASCYSTIGNIHRETENLDEALRYHMLSYALRDSAGYKRGVAMSLNNIGETYMEREEYDTALSYLQRSLPLKEELGDKKLIASTVDLLGETHYRMHNYPAAGGFYRRALSLRSEIGDVAGEAQTLNKLAELYSAWNKYDSALLMLERGRNILKDVPAKKTLLENYGVTVEVMRARGDADAALHFSDLYIRLKDTVFNQKRTADIAEMQAKYDSEKKDQEILLMTEREGVRVQELEQKNALLYSSAIGIALLIAVLILAFYLLRARQTALKQSHIIISQKQAMMSELHHRIKNNLQVLTGLLELQHSRITDPATKDLIVAVENRLNAMLLVHQELYGNNPGSLVDMQEYLSRLLKNLSASFGYDFTKAEEGLSVEKIALKADDALNIGFICNELISNSFKHAFPVTGDLRLTISLKRILDNLVLTYTDNGPGIPSDVAVANASTFGLRLVELFSRDLNATVHTGSANPGVFVQLIIPFKEYHT